MIPAIPASGPKSFAKVRLAQPWLSRPLGAAPRKAS